MLNLYRFCANNSLNIIDPDGEAIFEATIIMAIYTGTTMVKNVICYILLISCSCSPTRDQKVGMPYQPKVGDSIDKVYFYIGPSYFVGMGPEGGKIKGYLYDPFEGRYSGFGTDMIDENKDGVKAALLYCMDDIVRDILIVEGGITGELVDGSGWELFQEKWRQDSLKGEKRTHLNVR